MPLLADKIEIEVKKWVSRKFVRIAEKFLLVAQKRFYAPNAERNVLKLEKSAKKNTYRN